MNSRVLGLRVAGAVFGLMFVGQAVRLVAQLSVIVAGHVVPQWVSGVALLIAGSLAAWLWKLSLPDAAQTAT